MAEGVTGRAEGAGLMHDSESIVFGIHKHSPMT